MIITLTGPSCSGKTTLESAMKMHGFTSLVSTTTRTQRVNEVSGRSYYFTSREAFVANRDAGMFVESIEFNGNFYAVSKREVERVMRLGNPIVLIVEPNGLLQIRDYAEEEGLSIYSVFIDCHPEVLASRFLQRFSVEYGPDRKAAVLETFASRLAVMMTEERDWVRDALVCPYDLVLESFSETTEKAVLKQLVSVGFNEKKVAA